MYPVEHFKHTGVNPDGTFTDKPGKVVVDGGVTISDECGGCGVAGCNCSPGYWISVVKPRTPDGIVEGYTYAFDSHSEMLLAIQKHDLPLLTENAWTELEYMLSEDDLDCIALGRMLDEP